MFVVVLPSPKFNKFLSKKRWPDGVSTSQIRTSMPAQLLNEYECVACSSIALLCSTSRGKKTKNVGYPFQFYHWRGASRVILPDSIVSTVGYCTVTQTVDYKWSTSRHICIHRWLAVASRTVWWPSHSWSFRLGSRVLCGDTVGTC
jgi:hypothetical protein